ncbi:hypothetical protein WICMUC_000490 [Wickerhamomyces mucosus]|uniref:Uncharacterized protein n=1 Tax=Wickerhamomyces mucosus TaxID=1378264 RepID=A0A9P8TIU2_9ASCO|nr:hypothetical protein WICMUC_000490 [Wickerhamomyces mucosus]
MKLLKSNDDDDDDDIEEAEDGGDDDFEYSLEENESSNETDLLETESLFVDILFLRNKLRTLDLDFSFTGESFSNSSCKSFFKSLLLKSSSNSPFKSFKLLDSFNLSKVLGNSCWDLGCKCSSVVDELVSGTSLSCVFSSRIVIEFSSEKN